MSMATPEPRRERKPERKPEKKTEDRPRVSRLDTPRELRRSLMGRAFDRAAGESKLAGVEVTSDGAGAEVLRNRIERAVLEVAQRDAAALRPRVSNACLHDPRDGDASRLQLSRESLHQQLNGLAHVRA